MASAHEAFKAALDKFYARDIKGAHPDFSCEIIVYREIEFGAYWVLKIDRGYTIEGGLPSWHLCGYAYHDWRWKKPVPDFYDSNALLAHGGITYGEICAELKSLEWNIGTIAGFDCNHAGDESNPLTRNEYWVLEEARLLYEQMHDIYSQEPVNSVL